MKTAKKINIVGLKEFRLNVDKYIKCLDKGESFTILKRSKPVFKLVPIDEEGMWETVADFTNLDPDGISARDVIKSLRKISG